MPLPGSDQAGEAGGDREAVALCHYQGLLSSKSSEQSHRGQVKCNRTPTVCIVARVFGTEN